MLKHSLKKGLIALSLAACFALPLQAKVITDVEGNKNRTTRQRSTCC